jgi:hypothetical protein
MPKSWYDAFIKSLLLTGQSDLDIRGAIFHFAVASFWHSEYQGQKRETKPSTHSKKNGLRHRFPLEIQPLVWSIRASWLGLGRRLA